MTRELVAICRDHPDEAQRLMEGEGITFGPFYNALFRHFSDTCEMPYGVQKARSGDPFEWINTRMAEELEEWDYAEHGQGGA